MNQMLEGIKNLDAKYAPFLLAGVVVVIVFLDFFLFLRPQMGLLASLSTKNVQLKTDIEALQTNKQRTALFEKQLEMARRDTKNFDAMVRGEDGVPVVLKAISGLANEYGVKIDQLVPQPLDEKPVVQTAEGKYLGQTIFIVAYGGYHQFGKFMNRLEKERLFWKLDSLVIASDGLDPHRQKIKMNMRILVLKK